MNVEFHMRNMLADELCLLEGVKACADWGGVKLCKKS